MKISEGVLYGSASGSVLNVILISDFESLQAHKLIISDVLTLADDSSIEVYCLNAPLRNVSPA
jgi:hypothetical protein